MQPQVDLVYFNAGGGHRASAQALQSVIGELGLSWQVRLVDLFQVLDPAQRFRRMTGLAPEDWYNRRLARGWTLGMAQELKLLQALIRMAHPTLVRRLQRHWALTRPDLVVSLIPNFNRAMFDALALARPGVPYATVLTDLADHPPHFWIEPRQPQHLICGTPRAVRQALAAGHAPERVHATSGMILRPDFYRAPLVDRPAARAQLGLDPNRPTGLVLFGGHGSRAMLTIARQLPQVQLILLCGHNGALARQLQAMPAQAPRHVVGFTTEVPQLMDMADFFIGKPGPGSVSEAVQRGLPVIVVDNAWTMPQERYNPQWVQEHGLGIVHHSHRSIAQAVDRLLADLPALRERVRAQRNRALYEVPQILSRLLADAPAAVPLGLAA
ncbi:glycosyltransferase [Hydrogenophaga intermedia]|uniref:glycosyltransferase n=1 Tax=Hydrogenophaga intermedia TaxID=65786 RepID=UPI002043E73B|nr:glycosyltransferase [Hydrogenophaga intermedia]MCM3564805.1 galactosyldiacylglycerol synthase [Hydrogenophaga intermedia]